MIEPIRLATPDEVALIAEKSDLTPTSQVWAWPGGKDTSPDMAVIRQCVEVDPMHFAPTTSNQRKALFGWGLFNMLRATGTREIYFNVDAEGTEPWQKVLENMGGEKTTTIPQIRYKLIL